MGRLADADGIGNRGGAVEAVGNEADVPFDPVEDVFGRGGGTGAIEVAGGGGGPRSNENPPARPISKSAAPPASELTSSS